MRPILIALLLAAPVAATSTARAQGVEAGDWGAVRIGERCHLFSTRAARDTSGALVFEFSPGGYDAAFRYEYAPWVAGEDAPWDDSDQAVLEIDGAASWLGDEMWLEGWPGGGRADMTGGFVKDALAAFSGAQDSIGFVVHRAALGEDWLYGLFSADGFAEALAGAAEMCDFAPSALPES